MKLEVGMYVRTEEGRIHKIEELLGIKYYAGLSNNVIDVYGRRLITKASHNIIDLIENDDLLKFVDILGHESYVIADDTFKCLHPEYLEEILTKEQYKANVYEVD